ncbi:MAG: sulfur oxidation c-type cytochrome SoxX [Paracoccaceae bacterium]
MKLTTKLLAAGALAVAGAASADEVAPGAVEYGEYGEIAQSLTGIAGDPDNGRAIVVTRSKGNCVSCHTAEKYADVPFHGEVGPPLDGVAERWSEAELRGIVADAKKTYEGTVMPSFYKVAGYVRPGQAFTTKPAEEPLPPLLSAQEIEDVVAYLMTFNYED